MIFGVVEEMTVQTANPIGRSINVVEVFITNILSEAATIIKPPINFSPDDPTAVIIFNAILLCKPDLSIPKAKIKPPKKRYIFLLAYGFAAS